MAQLALNRFQTETLELTDSNQTAYTAPTGYTAIVLCPMLEVVLLQR